jgi:hypothetical protein
VGELIPEMFPRRWTEATVIGHNANFLIKSMLYAHFNPRHISCCCKLQAGNPSMPFSKRTLASRANGAKSQGPTSSAGKRRSSANSTRHGLLARSIVLNNESENVFGQFFDEHLQKHNPADGVEYAVVEEIVASAWRLRRIWDIESTLFNAAMDRSTANTEAGRAAEAFTSLGASNQLQLLDRYETRLTRMYQRGIKTLEQLRKVPQVQPHPEPAEPILTPSEMLEDKPGAFPNEPNSDVTPSADNDLPRNTQTSQESEEVVEPSLPPVALHSDNTNQPPIPNRPQSPRPNNSVPFQLIEFPAKT